MYCNNCGCEISPNTSFCPHCGAPQQEPPVQQTIQTPEQNYAQPQEQYAEPQYSRSVETGNGYGETVVNPNPQGREYGNADYSARQPMSTKENPSQQQWANTYDPHYNAQQPAQPVQPVQQPQYEPYNQNAYPANDEVLCGAPKVFSIISLVCGIISLVTCYVGIPFGIVAIIFSCVTKTKFKGKNTMGKLGLIFGIVGICIGIISIGVLCCTVCVANGGGDYVNITY